MRFAKFLSHARPPVKLLPTDPGLTIFSAENFKLEFGEVHSFRTGILLEIPDGTFGLLKETHLQGMKGVVVCGGLVGPQDVTELRVTLANNHRDAYEIKAGSPLAQLVLLPNEQRDDEADEVDRDELVESMEKMATAIRSHAQAEALQRDADEAAKKVDEQKEKADLAKKAVKRPQDEPGPSKPATGTGTGQ